MQSDSEVGTLMPRYYFHTLQGRPFRDPDGESLSGPAAAHRASVRIMGEILRDGAADFWDAGPFSLICADETGAVVTGLTARKISVEDSARLLHRFVRDA